MAGNADANMNGATERLENTSSRLIHVRKAYLESAVPVACCGAGEMNLDEMFLVESMPVCWHVCVRPIFALFIAVRLH